MDRLLRQELMTTTSRAVAGRMDDVPGLKLPTEKCDLHMVSQVNLGQRPVRTLFHQKSPTI